MTLLNIEGEIVEDSHSFIGERPSMANLPEVETARAAGLSLSHGSDPVLGAESVIVIRLVEVDGAPDGFVRVALPISDADDSIENLRTTAIVGGLLVVVAATLFAMPLKVLFNVGARQVGKTQQPPVVDEVVPIVLIGV